MAASALVTNVDVETALLRPLTSTEEPYIDGLCAAASVQLRAALPSVDVRIAEYAEDPTTPGAVNPELVASVLGGVIARFLRNPEGLTDLAKTTGPYSAQKSYGSSDVNPVGLTVTVADVARIVPTSSFVPARTIRTAPPRHHDIRREW